MFVSFLEDLSYFREQFDTGDERREHSPKTRTRHRKLPPPPSTWLFLARTIEPQPTH